MTRLILASASPSRARMLRDAGVSFEIRPAQVDEDAIKDSLQAEGSLAIADMLAELKAVRVSGVEPDALVLAGGYRPRFVPIPRVERRLAAAGQLIGAFNRVTQPFEDIDHADAHLRKHQVHETGNKQRHFHSDLAK